MLGVLHGAEDQTLFFCCISCTPIHTHSSSFQGQLCDLSSSHEAFPIAASTTLGFTAPVWGAYPVHCGALSNKIQLSPLTSKSEATFPQCLWLSEMSPYTTIRCLLRMQIPPILGVKLYWFSLYWFPFAGSPCPLLRWRRCHLENSDTQFSPVN